MKATEVSVEKDSPSLRGGACAASRLRAIALSRRRLTPSNRRLEGGIESTLRWQREIPRMRDGSDPKRNDLTYEKV